MTKLICRGKLKSVAMMVNLVETVLQLDLSEFEVQYLRFSAVQQNFIKISSIFLGIILLQNILSCLTGKNRRSSRDCEEIVMQRYWSYWIF
jgi:hypothetical protein